jgi:hypothetical protein
MDQILPHRKRSEATNMLLNVFHAANLSLKGILNVLTKHDPEANYTQADIKNLPETTSHLSQSSSLIAVVPLTKPLTQLLKQPLVQPLARSHL